MFPDFLVLSANEAAPRLLGCILEREIDGQIVHVKIVEVEAYDETDPASHAYGGQRNRNQVMFGLSGHLYVYFTYGMHYCCNIVTGRQGNGAGVLIRAVEPLDGIELLESRRGVTGVNVANGPGKLCQALGIDLTLNGHDLHQAPLRLLAGEPVAQYDIVQTTRVGISKAQDERRRWYIANNSWVSKK